MTVSTGSSQCGALRLVLSCQQCTIDARQSACLTGRCCMAYTACCITITTEQFLNYRDPVILYFGPGAAAEGAGESHTCFSHTHKHTHICLAVLQAVLLAMVPIRTRPLPTSHACCARLAPIIQEVVCSRVGGAEAVPSLQHSRGRPALCSACADQVRHDGIDIGT